MRYLFFFLSLYSSLYGAIANEEVVRRHETACSNIDIVQYVPSSGTIIFVETDYVALQNACTSLGADFSVTALDTVYDLDGRGYTTRCYVTQVGRIDVTCTGDTPSFCTAPDIFDDTINSCFTPPECSPTQMLSPDSKTCIPDPTTDPDGDPDGDGTPNKCDPAFIDYKVSDCDGDGIPNPVDDDIDGDGTPNDNDTSPNGVTTTSSGTATTTPDANVTVPQGCTGEDFSTIVKEGVSYAISDLSFQGSSTKESCQANLQSYNTYDGIAYSLDTNRANGCTTVYCYVHKLDGVETVCSNMYLSASFYLPDDVNDWVLYSTSLRQSECIGLQNRPEFSNSNFRIPEPIDCPDTSFCFVVYDPNFTPEDFASQDDEYPDNNEVNSSTSTTTDNKLIVDSLNTSNKHLYDIKNEAKTTNTNLKDILSELRSVTSATQSSHSTLNDISSNGGKINSSVKGVKTAIDSSNTNLRNINGTLLATQTATDRINDNLVNGLFTDIDPFANTEIKDGSEGFDGFETDLISNIGILNESNIFGLTAISSMSLPTYTANTSYGVVTVFQPSMLDGLPIEQIRQLIMFMFAMLGFIHTFRST